MSEVAKLQWRVRQLKTNKVDGRGKTKYKKIYVVYIETRIFVYNKAMSSDAASEERACSMKHR